MKITCPMQTLISRINDPSRYKINTIHPRKVLNHCEIFFALSRLYSLAGSRFQFNEQIPASIVPFSNQRHHPHSKYTAEPLNLFKAPRQLFRRTRCTPCKCPALYRDTQYIVHTHYQTRTTPPDNPRHSLIIPEPPNIPQSPHPVSLFLLFSFFIPRSISLFWKSRFLFFVLTFPWLCVSLISHPPLRFHWHSPSLKECSPLDHIHLIYSSLLFLSHAPLNMSSDCKACLMELSRSRGRRPRHTCSDVPFVDSSPPAAETTPAAAESTAPAADSSCKACEMDRTRSRGRRPKHTCSNTPTADTTPPLEPADDSSPPPAPETIAAPTAPPEPIPFYDFSNDDDDPIPDTTPALTAHNHKPGFPQLDPPAPSMSSTASTQTDPPPLYTPFHPNNFKEQVCITARNLYILKALSVSHKHGAIISKGTWDHLWIKDLLGDHGAFNIKENKILYYKSWTKIMLCIHPDHCAHPQTTDACSIYNSAKDFISQF